MFAGLFLFRSFMLSALLVLLTFLLSLLPVRAAGTAVCAVPSLAYAVIQDAVDDANCAVINLAAGTFHENVIIRRPVEIVGQGAAQSVVRAVPGGHVFNIKAAPVRLAALTITDGWGEEGGGITYEGSGLLLEDCIIEKNSAHSLGGGIYSRGEVTIRRGSIRGNTAENGGGIYSRSGVLSISGTRIHDNEAGGHAGGLYNGRQSQALLKNVSISHNTCRIDGGGIFNYGAMAISYSAVDHNTAVDFSGGGIRNEGSLNINNSTISHNKDRPVHGAGISNCPGSLRLKNVTLSSNEGVALYNCSGVVRVKNSILSGNAGRDCSGTIMSDGYNLVSDVSGCSFHAAAGDLLGVAAHLGRIKGSPAYRPLLFGPGINAADPAGCTDHLGLPLATDQRGMPRVGACDMGAFEYQGAYHQSYLPLAAGSYCGPFIDRFDDEASGWPVGEDDQALAAYLGGEYQIRSKQAGYVFLFESPACARDDYVVGADARWSGAPGLAYGLIFDMTGDFEQYYLFAINSEYQVFWLDYFGPGGWARLIEPVETDKINQGSATNRLNVTRNGSKIALAVNGVVVHRISDGRVSGMGGVGVFAIPYEDRPAADARFDDFVSRDMNQVGLTAVAAGRPSAMTQPFSLAAPQRLDLAP